MGHGNPNKVDEIVDEIVKNNNVFKLKSPIEQEKEKDSMARSINSALSVLTEEGIDLVLQDLSVDPDEKFKGFIDNAGNIDIQGITKYTATVVKTKIEETEREGVNIRINAVTNDNKDAKLSDAIIPGAIVGDMILNFDNLSLSERKNLADNYSKMTSEQQRDYLEALNRRFYEDFKSISGFAETEYGKKIEKEFVEWREILKKIKEISDECKGLEPTEEGKRICAYLKEVLEKGNLSDETRKDIIEELNKYEKNSNYNQLDGVARLMDEKAIISTIVYALQENDTDKLREFQENYPICYSKAEREFNKYKSEKNITIESTEKEKYPESYRLADKLDDEKKELASQRALTNEDELKMCTEEYKKLLENIQRAMNKQEETDAVSISTKSDAELLKDEIDDKLIKVFPPEKVAEYLEGFKKTLGTLEEDDIQKYKDSISNGGKLDVQAEIKSFFIEDGMDAEAAEILSQMDFNGEIWLILEDPSRRQEFFEQLEQLIEQNQEQQLTDTEVEQGIMQGKITQEELVVGDPNIRTTQGEQENPIIGVFNVNQQEDYNKLMKTSDFKACIVQTEVADSDLEETLDDITKALEADKSQNKPTQQNDKTQEQQGNIIQVREENDEDFTQ